MAPLDLIVLDDGHKTAQARGELARVLGVAIPAGWPHFPEAFAPGGPGADPHWPSYLIVSPADASLIGNGGYYGPPAAGAVEIGYEIAPAFRGRGFATAFVRTLIARAFADPAVDAVIAHTLAEKNASNAVLKKAGFAYVEEKSDADVGAVWLWRRAR